MRSRENHRQVGCHLAIVSVLAVTLWSPWQEARAIDVRVLGAVPAAPDRVWQLIGDFCSIDDWHPAITECVLEDKGPSGVFRTLTLGDGATILERLTAQPDDERSYSYAILESPLPIANYKATLTVRRGTDAGRSILEWTSTFDANGVSDEEAASLIDGVYRAGFDNVKALTAGN